MTDAATLQIECLRVAFAVTTDAMLVVDAASGRIQDANPAFCRMCGIDRERIAGRPLSELVVGSGEFILETPAGAAILGQLTLRRADGTSMTTQARRYHCGNAPDAGWLLVLESPGRSELPDQPLHSVRRDPLTGLPTRDVFDRQVAACLERVRRVGPPFFAVLFLDLDDFKPVNDHHGHAVGDRALAAVAERLAGAIRPGDLLSRRGGDEFTLLVDGIHSADEARHIAERLTARSREPVTLDGQALSVGVSVGVAFADGSIDEPAALIAAADRAMYEAKRRGEPVLYVERQV